MAKVESKFLRLAKAGLPIDDELAIDAHTHVGGTSTFIIFHSAMSKAFWNS